MSIDWTMVTGWINWGLLVNVLAAVGSVSAAVVALRIATRDRTERQRDREAAAMAQARLVLVEVEPRVFERGFTILVRNFGVSAVLDIKLMSVTFSRCPSAIPDSYNDNLLVLDADRESHSMFVDLRNPQGEGVTPGERGWGGIWTADDRSAWRDVIATIQFKDIHGNIWQRSTTGSVERVGVDAAC